MIEFTCTLHQSIVITRAQGRISSKAKDNYMIRKSRVIVHPDREYIKINTKADD